MTSPRNDNNRISAAADLICNLDAALAGVNAAAASAAEDAARARRNARVAGELARRYGGGLTSTESKGIKGGRKKRGDRASEGGTGGSSLLERKRERRAAARMAAEARHRRDHPISHSPRSFATPRSTREITGKGLFFGGGPPSSAPNNEANGQAALVDSGVAADPTPSAEGIGGRKAVGPEDVKKSKVDSDSFEGGVVGSSANDKDVSFTILAETSDAPPMDPNPIMDANEIEFGDAVVFSHSAEEMGEAQMTDGRTEESPRRPHQGAEHRDEDREAKAAAISVDHPPKQPSVPPTTPSLRGQPHSQNRIEASHAEDVLTLSLELERVRSELQSTKTQLSHFTEQATALKGQNDQLSSELGRLHSQLETHNERSSTQLSLVQEKLDAEQLRANAAEEDAALALELAKESQAAKEECEMWLTRSLEEIDTWRGRCGDLERRLKEQHQQGKREKNKVHWKDDRPPSPVVSEDGGYGGDDASPAASAAASIPPVWYTPKGSSIGAAAAINGSSAVDDSINSGETFASPASIPTPTSAEATPTKSAVASGRALLHLASPSPKKDAPAAGGPSPNPRLQASELMRKSAETRRLLRERLNSKQSGAATPQPPASTAKGKENRGTDDGGVGDGGSFASRQGAACRSVGRLIRESGLRLKLPGRWWDQAGLLSDGAGASAVEGGTVAQLESMVDEYCAGVEGVVGVQRERIDDLLAFCDFLETEVVSSQKGE